MIEEGMKAPDFSLPGIYRGEPEYYDLHRFVGRGSTAVLLFYPVDFVPTITPSLRAAGAVGWAERGDVVVWAISSDSLFAHEEYAETRDIDLPLLSDLHAGIADGYDVVHDDFRGHAGVPKWSVFVVDDDWVVRYAWSTDDPLATPPQSPLVGAAEALDEIVDWNVPVPTSE